MTTEKPWSGRFTAPTHPLVEAYTASLDVDRRLYREDIAGSIAHARMLAKQGIIPEADAAAIVEGLRDIEREIESGTFPWRRELEDVHMNIEARLAEKIGPTAGRLHTARSRNDQVATDLRLYAKSAIARAVAAIRDLQEALLDLAARNRRVIMPGYTHLQRAQPVLFAHHLLAYFEQLDRDAARFADCYRRTDVLPLGSGALAGSPYPLDREFVARELGFRDISANSIDAVSDRDFVVEFLAAAALCMTHLSRLAEEIALWSSVEFGFIRLPDEFATGSSIMPQKKNPDVAELARARAAVAHGHLLAMLGVLKGQPLAYNRDLQEDKALFFGAEDTLLPTLRVFAAMLPRIDVDARRARQAAAEGYALATDLADYLTRKGLPFREAHRIVGELVRFCEERRLPLRRLSLEDARRFSPL
ncbi:MAG TPA: argininosuccinate lyase, partial [Dehalococcoidia bacterium]|nr:argininosuccinate lyase [Dehalococcoidia bacterium]